MKLLQFLNRAFDGAKGLFKSNDAKAPARPQRARFAALAMAAAMRRSVRHQVKQRYRRNTRGLPVGFSHYQVLGKAAINNLPDDSIRRKNALDVQDAIKFGAKVRAGRLPKLTRRVQAKHRDSCSATKWMLDVMERRTA